MHAVRVTASVLIVDDHPAVREGIRAMLGDVPGLRPTAAASSGREALRLARELRPDVVVLDFKLPDMDGLSVYLRLKERHPGAAVALYSAFADSELAVLGVIAGADALVRKDADPDHLAEAVGGLADGGAEPLAPTPEALHSAGSRLHPDDLPILGLLTHRVAAAEIATTLGVQPEWLWARRWAMLDRLTAT